MDASFSLSYRYDGKRVQVVWDNPWRVGEQRRIRVLYTVVAPVAGAKEEWGRKRGREVAGGEDRESSRHGGRERRAPLAIHDSTPPLQACTSVGTPAMARALRTSFLTTRRRSTACPIPLSSPLPRPLPSNPFFLPNYFSFSTSLESISPAEWSPIPCVTSCLFSLSFLPPRARYWLPCMDVPAVRTTASFFLTTRPEHLSFANGERVDSGEGAPGARPAWGQGQ